MYINYTNIYLITIPSEMISENYLNIILKKNVKKKYTVMIVLRDIIRKFDNLMKNIKI